MGEHGALSFPVYSSRERAADRVIDCISVPLSIVAASATYQLSAAGTVKERLRRLDRAMIFLMIAGTYTPLRGGAALCGDKPENNGWNHVIPDPHPIAAAEFDR